MQHVRAVGFSEDILDKAKAQTALPLQAQLNREAVAASEGGLVVDFSAGEDQVVALFVEAGKAEAEALQILVAGVFEVVLVHGVVDDALEIAFVVADG